MLPKSETVGNNCNQLFLQKACQLKPCYCPLTTAIAEQQPVPSTPLLTKDQLHQPLAWQLASKEPLRQLDAVRSSARRPSPRSSSSSSWTPSVLRAPLLTKEQLLQLDAVHRLITKEQRHQLDASRPPRAARHQGAPPPAGRVRLLSS